MNKTLNTMVKITYNRYYYKNVDEPTKSEAYFSNYKQAMKGLARWKNPSWIYELISVEEVPLNSELIHKDEFQYG